MAATGEWRWPVLFEVAFALINCCLYFFPCLDEFVCILHSENSDEKPACKFIQCTTKDHYEHARKPITNHQSS